MTGANDPFECDANASASDAGKMDEETQKGMHSNNVVQSRLRPEVIAGGGSSEIPAPETDALQSLFPEAKSRMAQFEGTDW